MILLLALGIAVGAMGLLALGFGIPIKETTFGNSLMLGGATAIGSGLILIGLAFVVRELKALAQVIGQGGVQGGVTPAARPSAASMLPPLFPKAPASAGEDYDAPQFQPPPSPETTPQAAPQATPPWATEAAARGRPPAGPLGVEPPLDLAPEPVPGEPPPLAPLVMPPRPKRNLLFPSRRKDPPPAVEATSPAAGEIPAAPPRAPVIPPVQPQEPRHEPRMTFDSAWPANGPGAAPHMQAPAAPPAPQPPEGVTVIKSGTVDGMAYTLYSDGSIEAQMSEGMLRFASLEELRTYLAGRP